MRYERLVFDTKVKIYFGLRGERTPCIGMFFKFKDHNELERKNMVRFIHLSKLDHFDVKNPQIALSVIFTASAIESLTIVNEKKKDA